MLRTKAVTKRHVYKLSLHENGCRLGLWVRIYRGAGSPLALKNAWICIALCLPSDVHPDRLKAAATGKQDGYSPLVLALGHCLDNCLTVHVFPWVLGLLSLIDPSHLAFLGIPSKHSKAAVKHTVLASVKSLYFKHQVHYGGVHGRKRAADNQQNNISEDQATHDEELLTDLKESGCWLI